MGLLLPAFDKGKKIKRISIPIGKDLLIFIDFNSFFKRYITFYNFLKDNKTIFMEEVEVDIKIGNKRKLQTKNLTHSIYSFSIIE